MPIEGKETAYILRKLAACPLFIGFSAEEVGSLLPLLAPEIVCHHKGSQAMNYGDPARTGLVLGGLMTVSQEIYGEAMHIVELLEGGDLFCIDVAFSGEETSYTDLIAECDCRILFLVVIPLSKPQ